MLSTFSCRMRRGAVLATILVASCLTAALAHDAAWYLARPEVPGGALLELHVNPETGEAHGALREAPAASERGSALNLALTGTATIEEARVRAHLDAFPATEAVAGPGAAPAGVSVGTVTVRADRARGREGLDPFGAAEASYRPTGNGAERTFSLAAIATRYELDASLADGSFTLTRTFPFFYAAPWADLPLRSRASPDPTRRIAEGLSMRAERPMGATSRWFEEAVTDVTALTRTLVSTRTTVHAYTGGAHPDTRFSFATFVREGDGWHEAGLCRALAEVGRSCPEEVLREEIVRDLQRQEAAWVTSGEVTREADWLLAPFVLTPSGVRFDYAPYRVGPYAQGPFSVTVPYAALP